MRDNACKRYWQIADTIRWIGSGKCRRRELRYACRIGLDGDRVGRRRIQRQADEPSATKTHPGDCNRLRERMREPVIPKLLCPKKSVGGAGVPESSNNNGGCVSSARRGTAGGRCGMGTGRPRLTILPACSAETRQSKTRIDSQISLWPDQARPSARFHTHQMIIKSRESRFRSPT